MIAVDSLLWAVTLTITVLLARLVYRQRDLPARLFLGMVAALVVPQAHYLFGNVAQLLSWMVPDLISKATIEAIWALWPVDIAALVAFGCLTLHLFLIFPTESQITRVWRWSLVLFYVPGIFLMAMILTFPILGPEGYASFWGLARLGLRPSSPQVAFAIVTVGLATLRLALIYVWRANPRLRQRLTWILSGLVLGGGFALLTDYVPAVLGQEPPVGFVPGLRQLPILILLGAFALSMQRYHVFDVGVVLSRSVVYSILAIVLTGLYVCLVMLMGYLSQYFSSGVSSLGMVMIGALLIALFALLLRDAIQRRVDRLFLRRRASYREALQDFSRLLTGPVALPQLLEMIAEQVEELFHPTGLAILLGDKDGYRVMLSRGKPDPAGHWQMGTVRGKEDEVYRQLASRRQPLYLPCQVGELAAHEQERLRQEPAVQLLIPMHLRNDLTGWFVLGPKLSELGYNREDLEFLSALADQACVALENARLYSEMKQRATELALLAIVSSTISSSLDLEQVLRTIVESVTKVISCDKSAIFELSEDGRFLSLRMSKGLSPAYLEGSRRIPVQDSNRALALVGRQPLIVPDIHDEPRLDSLIEMARAEGFRGVVDVPLAGLEGLLGILSVYFDQVYRPTPAELEILTTFASQAAIAIENARLYATATRERDRAQRLYEQTDAALARRVEELTAIEEISKQLASTLDLDRLMNLVLEQSLLATAADRAVISLYDAQAGSLRMVAQHGYPAELERYKTEPWPQDLGITGRVTRTGLPALVADVRQDPDYVAGADSTRSQISVPVIYETHVIGVITLESDQVGAFGREHLRFAELLADHAAIGINNAQLFAQVRQGRDQLEAILNSTRDAVIVLDTAGRIVLTNPRVAELLGRSVEEWLWSTPVLKEISRPASPIFHWTDIGIEELSRALRRKDPNQEPAIELAFNLHLAESEVRRYIEVTATRVVGASGQLMGWVAVVRDMTRQQQLEQFREDMTSMVIHNLQGPLAAVIGSLETLLELEEMDKDMADRLLSIALDSGRKLYSRIESLLWLRRLEDSQMPLQLEPLPLAGVVDSVMGEYRAVASKSGVELCSWLPSDLPPVMVDGEVIGRVFSNLLDNALKYTPAEGRVQVQARVSPGQPEESVLCAVTDTGPGIAASVRDAIFGKFHRGQETQTGQRRGMGIGLHYCKLAIEAHGGRIWVESREGEGSTFYFTLPLRNGPLPPAAGRPGADRDHGEASPRR